MTTDLKRSPSEKLADFKAKHPDRVATVERIVRRMLGISPRVEAPKTVAVHVDDLLNAVFGIQPEEAQ